MILKSREFIWERAFPWCSRVFALPRMTEVIRERTRRLIALTETDTE